MAATPARSLLLMAGGRATRLGGVSKPLLDIGGQAIVHCILAALQPLADESIALANGHHLDHVAGLRTCLDPAPHAGVLPALARGLSIASGHACLVVAGDMPFASRAVFSYLLSLLDQSRADVVIPRDDHGLQPLHAVYRRATVLPAIQAALARGERRLASYFGDLRVREVSATELRPLDPTLRAFWNVNTPEDLAQARAWLEDA